MAIDVGIITVSDRASSGEYEDQGGPALRAEAEKRGWNVLAEAVVPDDLDRIQESLRSFSAQGCGLILTTGGTGISRRDGTYEVVSTLIEKRIDGFGELFRALSFEEIGPAAMLSRACAGGARGTILISLPGSQNAVRLAMTRLVIPELGHLVREVTR